MKYTKEGGDIELRHAKGIWELAPTETEDKAGGVLKEFGVQNSAELRFFLLFSEFPTQPKETHPGKLT